MFSFCGERRSPKRRRISEIRTYKPLRASAFGGCNSPVRCFHFAESVVRQNEGESPRFEPTSPYGCPPLADAIAPFDVFILRRASFAKTKANLRDSNLQALTGVRLWRMQ